MLDVYNLSEIYLQFSHSGFSIGSDRLKIAIQPENPNHFLFLSSYLLVTEVPRSILRMSGEETFALNLFIFYLLGFIYTNIYKTRTNTQL